MTSYPESRPADITHYFGVLRGRWRPIIAGAATGLLAATGFLAITGSSYTATTDLNINVISTDPFNAQRSASGLLDGVTEAQIAGSYVVAARAAETLANGFTPDDLRDGVDVSTISDATIMRISYTADSPDEARDAADALAEAYLAYRAAQARERLGGVIEQIEERLAGLREELTDANARAAASEPGTTEANQAASDRDLITIEIDSLLEEKNALDLINTSGGSVLNSASENSLVSGPRLAPALLGGLFGGLILGVIAAFVLDATNRRLSSVRDVERVTGGPVLTRITTKGPSVPPVGATLDQLRTARERLYASLEPGRNVIALFDCTRSSHPSDVPVGLAAVLARGGRTAQVVFPGITREFRDLAVRNLKLHIVESRPGGTRYSTADGRLSLHVPTTGGLDSEPDGLITDYVKDVITSSDRESFLFVALPPSAPQASLLAAGRLADAIGLIVTVATTRAQDLTDILGESALLDVPFIGTLVVPEGWKRSRAPAEAVRN